MLNRVTLFDVKELIMLKYYRTYSQKFLRKIFKTFEDFRSVQSRRNVGKERKISAAESLQVEVAGNRPHRHVWQAGNSLPTCCFPKVGRQQLTHVLFPKGPVQAADSLTGSLMKNVVRAETRSRVHNVYFTKSYFLVVFLVLIERYNNQSIKFCQICKLQIYLLYIICKLKYFTN